jgi:Putative beta-barrel porin-2, OmpL-like. bbp2
MRIKAALITFFLVAKLLAQSDSALQERPSQLTFSTYIETYYSHVLGEKSKQVLKPNFLYSFKENNAININLALLKANYSNNKVRANLALMTGNYAEYNLAAESPLSQAIYEANAGVKLSEKEDLWLDAGVMPSHIGAEGQLANENLSLTRSITAENSPYFETGARLSYLSKNKKWFFAAYILNGWQRIRKLSGSTKLSYGTQIQYKPNTHNTFNSSQFIGTDKPDSDNSLRYFHDFYWQYESKRFTNQLTLDIGTENTKSYSGNNWWGATWLMRYYVFKKLGVSVRVEYFNDEDNVLISNPFNAVFGSSLGLEYKIINHALIRLEARSFADPKQAENIYFKVNKNFTFISTSFSVWF